MAEDGTAQPPVQGQVSPEPLNCPSCRRGRLEFVGEWATCPNCGHRAPLAFAAELMAYNRQYASLLTRRAWLEEQLAAGASGAYVTLGLADSAPGTTWRVSSELWQRTPPPPVTPPDWPTLPTAAPTQRPSSSARPQERPAFTVSSALYIVGAGLLVLAFIGFAALMWRHLGAVGQGAVLAVGALALAFVAHRARKRLPGLALTLAVLATVIVPIVVFEGAGHPALFSHTWVPVVAAAVGALAAWIGWVVSRIDSYPWAAQTMTLTALLFTVPAMSSPGSVLTANDWWFVLLGGTAMIGVSIPAGARAFRSSSLIIGTSTLVLALVGLPIIVANTGYTYLAAGYTIAAGLCVLIVEAAWRQSNLTPMPFIGWTVLFIGVARLGFGHPLHVTWWTPLPLLVVSLAALASRRLVSWWPSTALTSTAGCALAIAVVFNVPGSLTPGTANLPAKIYTFAAGALLLGVGRYLADQLGRRIALFGGWLLLLESVASIGVIWVAGAAQPTAVIALPGLAASIVMVVVGSRRREPLARVAWAVGVVGLAFASATTAMAFLPQQRWSWVGYGAVVVVTLIVLERPITRIGLAGTAVRSYVSVLAGAVIGIAVATGLDATTLLPLPVALVASAIALALLLGVQRIKVREFAFVASALAAGFWAAALMTQLISLHLDSSDVQREVIGVFILSLAIALAITTWHTRNLVSAWGAAATFSIGWALIAAAISQASVEVFTLPIAIALLLAGVFTGWQRSQEDLATSSWVIFTPALVVGLIPSIVMTWRPLSFGQPDVRWLVMIAAAVVLTVLGANSRLAGIFVPALVALVLGAIPPAVTGTSHLLKIVPSWVFFAAIGIVLIVSAARLESLRAMGRSSKRWLASLS